MQFLSGLSGSQFGQLGLEFGLGFGELGDLALNSFNSCATNDHYYRRMWYALQFDSVMADTATNNNNNITVMDTSNSPPPDSMDSRKRNAESSPDNLKTKRTNYGGGKGNGVKTWRFVTLGNDNLTSHYSVLCTCVP